MIISFFMGTLSSHIVLNLQFWRTNNLYPVTQTTSNHQNDENEHLFLFFSVPLKNANQKPLFWTG